ncbi:hypothetical protein [Oceanimonas sp. GK1]|uniref:hypothetical protein n=1 Tax=Oceanimonas sp. (strain GK1 / IBRC-M 10197) TaxID=511062 RepID=UPI0002F04F6D|nr:hypothetical protein [Oceanimonas sp. GK1]
MRLNPEQMGSMLLSVIFILVILSALMAAMVTLSGQSSRQLVYEVQALKARLAAEAVLERQVFASLTAIDAPAVVSKDDESPMTVNGCVAFIKSLDGPTLAEGTSLNQVSVVASGECEGSGLTVIRNIEVEVIK